MSFEEDDELAEILNQRKERLLKELARESSEKKNNGSQNAPNIVIENYLTDKAKKYLNEKFDGGSKHKVKEALKFLIVNRLVEPKLDVEAIAYIARRVLGFDYKIYVEDEGEYKEL